MNGNVQIGEIVTLSDFRRGPVWITERRSTLMNCMRRHHRMMLPAAASYHEHWSQDTVVMLTSRSIPVIMLEKLIDMRIIYVDLIS
jgi:hypothetical protein